MTVTHPVALRDGGRVPGAYTYGTTSYQIDSDGAIDCPSDLEAEVAEALADHYDVDAVDLLEDASDDTDADESGEICGAEMSDGSTCERPADECPYHGGED